MDVFNRPILFSFISGTQLDDVSLDSGGSIIIASISISEVSTLSLTVSSASGSASAITLAAYLKIGSRPSFGDFTQVKPFAQLGETIVFNKVEVGNWFILIYNDGEDLVNLNIAVVLQGKIKATKE